MVSTRVGGRPAGRTTTTLSRRSTRWREYFIGRESTAKPWSGISALLTVGRRPLGGITPTTLSRRSTIWPYHFGLSVESLLSPQRSLGGKARTRLASLPPALASSPCVRLLYRKSKAKRNERCRAAKSRKLRIEMFNASRRNFLLATKSGEGARATGRNAGEEL